MTKPNISPEEIIKRYLLFIISLFASALGVAITKRGELGVSPISSVANILSYKFEFLTIGSWLIVWNCILIAGQIIILRRNFQPIQLLQVPLSFLFGWFTDFGMWIASFYSGNFLSHPADFSSCRSDNPRLWNFAVRDCECHYEFRGSFCKSNFRQHSQGIWHCKNHI